MAQRKEANTLEGTEGSDGKATRLCRRAGASREQTAGPQRASGTKSDERTGAKKELKHAGSPDPDPASELDGD